LPQHQKEAFGKLNDTSAKAWQEVAKANPLAEQHLLGLLQTSLNQATFRGQRAKLRKTQHRSNEQYGEQSIQCPSAITIGRSRISGVCSCHES
jgi:hypothetical protein